jgi:arylsulfatase A-like enzyme
VAATIPLERTTSSPGAKRTQYRGGRLAVEFIVFSVWCGLLAGLLEVATRVVARAIDPTKRLYLMSRHFVWLIPLANMVVFLGLGLVIWAATRRWPNFGRWLCSRLFGALVILPVLMVAAPKVDPPGAFLLTLGISVWLVPWLYGRVANPQRVLGRSLPVLVSAVMILAGSVPFSDWLKERREAARPLPPADCPSVLLIVLDTVRADRLSLYGYPRATAPNLERLARRGIRFDAARATAPWTLPSHASFFTGRWPHELHVDWMTPIRTKFPMLAEYLGSRGYATGGVVSNAGYCSYETGLSRGFTFYDDYQLVRLGFLRTSVIVEWLLLKSLMLDVRYHGDPPWSWRHFVERWFYVGTRRDAESINRSFLDWLALRPETGRPFFGFLNYMEAHAPYQLPEAATPRFGRRPITEDEMDVIYDNWGRLDKDTLPPSYITLARDAYDSCLAYLDEQIGALCSELERRNLLDNTLVIILSDHGEGLGEHDLWDHGFSLYSTEIRVPLVVLLPGKTRSKQQVSATVSLRDIPATVVDLVGLAAGSPFPGRSLAPLWGDSTPPLVAPGVSEAVSELVSVNPKDAGRPSPAADGPLLSVAEGDFLYIRHVRDGTEQLFNTREDPRELTNRAGNGAFQPVLEKMRARVTALNRDKG